jgi:hypothetical protein
VLPRSVTMPPAIDAAPSIPNVAIIRNSISKLTSYSIRSEPS